MFNTIMLILAIIADMLEQRERELIEQGARVGDCFNTCYGWKIKQGKWQEQAAELLKIGQKRGAILYKIEKTKPRQKWRGLFLSRI